MAMARGSHGLKRRVGSAPLAQEKNGLRRANTGLGRADAFEQMREEREFLESKIAQEKR
jgi:hypothetical protein